MAAMYGRNDDEWDQLASVGEEILVEFARKRSLTTYSEFNGELVRRSGMVGFDFSLQRDRTAMGHLLWLIVTANRPTTNLMLSALVRYIDMNDAGTGFYGLAADLGLLPRRVTSDAKLAFWTDQVKRLYAYYANGHTFATPVAAPDDTDPERARPRWSTPGEGPTA